MPLPDLTGISPLASVASGLIGGIFSNAAQRSANKTNLQIAREQNELNYRMFQEQNAWNLEQWNRENAYNDPSAQMARLQAAGINPYMALGNITAGTAMGKNSASPQPAVGARVYPVTGLSEGIQSAVQNGVSTYLAAAQVEKLKSETQQTNIDNLTRLAENMKRLDALGLDNEAKQLMNVFNRETLQVRIDQEDASLQQIMNQADMFFAQTRKLQLENNITEKFGSQMAEEQLNLLRNQVMKTFEEAKQIKELLPYQKADYVARRTVAYAQANHLNASASQIYALTPLLSDMYRQEIQGLSIQNKQNLFDYMMNQTYSDKWYEMHYGNRDIEKGRFSHELQTYGDDIPLRALGILGLSKVIGSMKAVPKKQGFGYNVTHSYGNYYP